MKLGISVVIPLYNKEELIESCLMSVINQSKKVDEIIIINDGSKDNSVNVVKNVIENNKDHNIILFEQENQGVSVARNKGISLASFEYICLLDADDLWKKEFISKVHELIYNYPDASMYCLGHEVVRKTGRFKPKHGLKSGFQGYVDDFFKSSLVGSVAKSSKVCIKKSKLEQGNLFPEGVTAGEDLYVWISLALKGKVVCDTESLCIVNQIEDESRGARVNSVPYPLEYYSRNKEELTFHAKNYISLIGYKHAISALFKGDINLFIKRWVLTYKFSRVRAVMPFYLLYIVIN
ncbi:glycosyltransferase family 2 protein [Vibrio parahaemolyticus]|nr:glycosyltransferase family 2 protein [Vibrio parahaemolyticus]MDF5101552.1 glycosyltransferase family 2 protein [Vibrio parahaemolyticus]MDF5260294.1 glycosyltransferase family 2 protein [Vibrio parahaemolyticus]